MDPEIWGSSAWLFLHTITLNYPNNPSFYDKQYYTGFFKNLEHVLPCDFCSHNYKLHLEKYPIENYLNSKKDLIQWLIHIHNEVNIIFNKKKMTYDEFILIYKNIYNKKKSYFYIYLIIILVIIISVIVFILFKFQYLNRFFQFH